MLRAKTLGVSIYRSSARRTRQAVRRLSWSTTGSLTSDSNAPDTASVMLSSNEGSRRPSSIISFASGISSALQGGEPGQNGSTMAATTQQRLTDEMDEIKRYEDFTTIDWVQDAAREQAHRRAKRLENNGPYQYGRSWAIRKKIGSLYDAGQAWIVVTLVGAAIGLNAAFLNIVTEWLSDIKLGHCTTAFYLNENFCCWGAENGSERPFVLGTD